MTVTDIKNKIPEGWQIKNVANLCSKISMGETLIADKLTGEGIPVFSANTENRPWGYTSNNRLNYSKGTIILGARGSIGFPRLPEFEKYTSTQTTIALFPKINSKYLFYLLSKLNFSDIADQQAVPMLTVESTNNVYFIIPQNPKEQQKIAEVLTTIDEAIEKTDAIIEKNKRIKQGLMQDLFRYGIDEHGNIRSEKTHKFKTVKIGNEEMRIPEEWEMGNITDYLYIMTDYVANGSFSSLNENVNVYDTENYAYYVRLYDLRLGLGHKNQTYVDKSSYLFLRKSFVEYEDILIANIGAYAGMVWSVPKLDKKATIAPNMLILKTNDKSEKKYLYYYLKSQIGEKEINNVIGGSGQPKISKTELKTIEIIKISKPEQRRIIHVLNSSDEIIEKEQIYKQKLLSIKRGLMEDLLTGTVRVNSLITN